MAETALFLNIECHPRDNKWGGANRVKLSLQIEPEDIERVQALLAARQDDAFVKHRVGKNLGAARPQITKRAFWERMVACLLTTQQRSGPKSAVNQGRIGVVAPKGVDIGKGGSTSTRYWAMAESWVCWPQTD